MSCNVFRFVLSIVVVLMGVGCKKNANVDVTYRPGIIQMTSKDFLIPRELKSQIDSEYIRFIRRNNPKVIREDHELLEDLPRDFLNVQIAFRASANGVLSDHTEFSLPRGGGMIDLKQYVKGTKGSFFMTMAVQRTASPGEPVENFRVYYLSEAKKREIAGESYGAGCKKFMDISNLVSKSNSTGGLQLNATDQRYVSVVAGVYYFVEFSVDQKIYISAVRITDSRYPELLCEQ